MKEFWDQRYSQKEYAYGEIPNEYFRNQITSLTPGKILMPADGEGRNGVFAATLGWKVDAFDISTEGKRKAELLADKHKVNIHYVIGACGQITFPENSFDVIALVYMHLPPAIMAECHRQMVEYLKPGGVIHLKTDSEFLHGYTLGLLQGLGYEILTAHHDIYGAPEYEPGTPLLRDVRTYYEELFSAKGKTITYIKFRVH